MDDLHGQIDVALTDHGKLYTDTSGVYTNGTKSSFPGRAGRDRVYHRIAGAYLVRYAQ